MLTSESSEGSTNYRNALKCITLPRELAFLGAKVRFARGFCSFVAQAEVRDAAEGGLGGGGGREGQSGGKWVAYIGVEWWVV